MIKLKQAGWLAILIAVCLSAGMATAASVDPILIDPWTSGDAEVECEQAEGCEDGSAYKIEWGQGNDGDYGVITISGSDDKTFNWSSSEPVCAVIVKAGTAAYVYYYSGAYSDTGLVAPADKEISHATFCYSDENGGELQETLQVTKTVVTSYNRTHFWSIDKSVDTYYEYEHDGFPKIWLYNDGRGNENATWTVNVNYTGSGDSDHKVSGVITIENQGNVPANITSVVDELAGTPIDVECGVTFPYTLPAGQNLTCSYSEDVSGMIGGYNNVTVTTFNETRDVQNLTYTSLPEPIEWGGPDNVFFETVNVTDESDLFGEVNLGTVTAPNNMTFTNTSEFAWDDYGKNKCGDYTYNNTATIVETGEYANATLKVNVQPLITVEKTVDTSYNLTHNWSIDKSVTTENNEFEDGVPKVWLYTDGTGDENATWTVNVNYTGSEDSDHKVSGTITISNDCNVDVNITSIVDELAGTPVDVECGVTFPYTLPAGQNLTCSYSEDVNGTIGGYNNVTVTTFYGWNEFNSTANDSVEVVWGGPDNVFFETVNVTDVSDLFGEVDLGSVTAPNNMTSTYDKSFAWADYGADGCGDFIYDNTATIVETEQSDSATLKVNVQCYDYETAYAMADDNETCFISEGFSNWGWTNQISPGTYEWDLWAAAGQCDTSKGTLVGNVTVTYGADGYVTVDYNVDDGYLLKETHVYADYAKFPTDRRGNPTVAPGQYTNNGPFDGSEVYVIAHAVVGIPDPTFGP
ncbi:MAG: hypothetical protein PWP63_1677 [Methanolobus sp.]|nr:hypothetical protein [Methanolobus sp.]